MKNALTRLFNYDLNQASPVKEDVARVVKYDEDGNEYIVYEKVDYKKLQESLGSVNMWSLESLVKAGIDPAFPIHTGNPTRLEGQDALDAYIAEADAIFADADSQNNGEII